MFHHFFLCSQTLPALAPPTISHQSDLSELPATALGLQEAAAALATRLLGQDHQTKGRRAETWKCPGQEKQRPKQNIWEILGF